MTLRYNPTYTILETQFVAAALGKSSAQHARHVNNLIPVIRAARVDVQPQVEGYLSNQSLF